MSSMTIRRWHSYIGLFIAPSVLFFALTGAVQIFSLHESHGDYKPLAIVEKLSSVHKDQVFALGHHHDKPAPGADADTPHTDRPSPPSADTPSLPDAGTQLPPGAKDDDDDKTELSTWMLKGFFLGVALCLSVSTAFGLWMGLTQTRQKRLAYALVIAGAVIPAGLLLL
jgi:hypothetical protein